MFPVHDSESQIILEEKDRDLGQLFRETRKERMKCITSNGIVETLLRRAWNLVLKYIRLRVPSLEKLLEECSSSKDISSIKTPLMTSKKNTNTLAIICGDIVVEP